MADQKENPLSISWHDSTLIPVLNPTNIMDYFAERTNPFYDRTCNNEIIRMQRLGLEHLGNMVGLEYCLIHVQEPILYIIRKQHRHSPTQVTPLADYYILDGVVYQAPDMSSVIGSRMLSLVHHMQSAFEEASMYSRYHPSKGYWWEFKDSDSSDKSKAKDKSKDEPGSFFQRRRVDILLNELSKKFPPKMPSPPQLEKQTTEEVVTVKTEPKEPKVEVKLEKPDTPSTVPAPAVQPPQPPLPPQQQSQARSSMKPPPEKKPRLAL